MPGICLNRAMASANKRSCHRFISLAMFPLTEQSPNTPQGQDCLLIKVRITVKSIISDPAMPVNRILPGILFCDMLNSDRKTEKMKRADQQRGKPQMKIAVFYENIYEGVQATGRQMEDVLTELRDAGLEMLYFSFDSLKRDREKLAGIMDKLGLHIEGVHGFCDFAADPDTDRFREMIDLAADAGAGNFLIIPGLFASGNTRRDLERMVTGTRKAAEYGRKRNIPVLMEDFDGLLSPYNCIAGLRYFMESVEGLECAFDTGNFAAFHEDELEAFDLFADRIRTVHLKDRSLTRRHEGDTPFVCADGKSVYACAIGSGFIRIAEILARLKQHGYSGNVIAELYACDPHHVLQDAADSVRWLKERI